MVPDRRKIALSVMAFMKDRTRLSAIRCHNRDGAPGAMSLTGHTHPAPSSRSNETGCQLVCPRLGIAGLVPLFRIGNGDGYPEGEPSLSLRRSQFFIVLFAGLLGMSINRLGSFD